MPLCQMGTCLSHTKRNFLVCKGKWNFGSWMWKKLLKQRLLAETFARVEVQRGSSTSFWFDAWTKYGKLIEVTRVRGCIDLGIRINATVEMAVTNHRCRRHRVEFLNLIENEIQAVQRQQPNHNEDIRMWRGKGNKYKKNFSTKETWHLTREVQQKFKYVKVVWFQFATPKYSFLVWLAILGKLATGDRISLRNNQADTYCSLCNDPWETRDHLLFSCRYSEEIWKDLTQHLLQSKYTIVWENSSAYGRYYSR